MCPSLTAGSTRSFAYDRYGNQTTEALSAADQRTMAYDTGRRLIGLVTAGGTSATFTPDALGRQRSRLVGTTTETYAVVSARRSVWAGPGRFRLPDATRTR